VLNDLNLPSPDEAIGWIVEGAGGALVPLNDTELMADLMRSLLLPVVIVARSELGTINHTLLTLEALRARKLCVAGVVMVGKPDRDNREAIEHYGRVSVLGEMPLLDPLNAAAVRRWAAAELDPYGRLAEFFG
jgi:malonyl-CoA O-methyltransferase